VWIDPHGRVANRAYGWNDSKSSVQPVMRHRCHLITPQAMRAPPPPNSAGVSE